MNISSTPTHNILRWVARIWSLPAIIFILGEVIFPHAGDAAVPFSDWIALGLQITAVIGLAIAWRYEIFGGTLSIITMLSSFVVLSIASETILWQPGLLWFAFIIAPASLLLYCGIHTPPNSMRPA